ncbi:MAG TPA: hypothetical protein PKA49_02940 [Tepidiformaceae bacterium]|mgnify:CR=1 FL=1|nr:hypothetical protein [Thermoflexaceae bacterium]HMS57786.1 hypothetical protein [Tepidiformaceae bacterium]
MEIEVLTFRIDDVPSNRVALYIESVELAIGEFDGLVSSHWVHRSGGEVVGVVAWETERDLERFRHSELYARLVMDPCVNDCDDAVFEAGRRSPELPTAEEVIEAWMALAA